MISLPLDEGYAFDYLSILEVKTQKTSSVSKDYLESCKSHIVSQIGEDLFCEIYFSKEYSDLHESNLMTFEAIERLRSDKEITAKEIDDLNSVRFVCKKDLQRKFFKSETKETKTINEISFRQ